MKTKQLTSATSLVLALLASLSLPPLALGQGELTPPGAPAPTMKSLDQIEPRTVITSLPWTISTPGAYVVTGNLSLASGNGILVASSNVTLDLNGFVLTGAAGGGHGIVVPAGVENVRIKNGVLRDWGADGIHAPDAGFVSIRNVQIYGSGGNGVAMNKAELIDAIARNCARAGVSVPKQTQGATFGERIQVTGNGEGGVVISGTGEVTLINSQISGNTGPGISWVSSEADATFRLDLGGVACDNNSGDGVHANWSGTAARTFLSVKNIGTYSSRASGNGGNGVTVVADAMNMFLEIEVKEGEFTNNGSHGMYIEGGTKGVIDLDGSTFSGNTQAGLILIADNGVKPGSVNRVNASHNGSHGIQIQASGVYRFSGCRVAGNGGDGIHAERPAAGADRWGELIFETNDLVGNGGAGLNIPANSTASVVGTVLVSGGLVSGNATAGIIIADDGVKPGSVNRVSITGNGGHGLAVAGHDFAIADNLISRNNGSGIRITGTGAHLARNQCSANVTGIEVTGLGNAVRENIFGGTAAQMPLNVTTPGNAVAPTQNVETGTNPLGNVGY